MERARKEKDVQHKTQDRIRLVMAQGGMHTLKYCSTSRADVLSIIILSGSSALG